MGSLSDWKEGVLEDESNDATLWNWFSGKWKDITGQSHAENMEMLNYQHSLDQFEYQKSIQQQMFDREDTAYSRKVEDMKKAGLNPILAAGGAGAGSGPVVKTQAPQKGAQSAQMQQANVQNALSSILGVIRMKADIARTSAETQVANAQANKINAEGKYLNQTMDSRINSQKVKEFIQTQKSNYTGQTARAQLNYLQQKETLTWSQTNQIIQNTTYLEQKVITEQLRQQGLLKDLDIKDQQKVINAWIVAYKEYDLRMYGNMGLPTTSNPSMGHQYLSTAQTALDQIMSDIQNKIRGWKK